MRLANFAAMCGGFREAGRLALQVVYAGCAQRLTPSGMLTHTFFMCSNKVRRGVAGTLVALCAFITGCVSNTLTPQQISSIHRVGVASRISDEYNYHFVGTTIFGNEQGKLKFVNIDPRKEAVDVAVQAITKKEAVAMPPDSFAIISSEGNPSTARMLFGELGAPAEAAQSDEQIAAAIREESARRQLDAVLLISSATTNDFIAGTNQSITGLGRYTRGFFGMKKQFCHAVLLVQVYDGKTGKVLAGSLSTQAVQTGVPWESDPTQYADYERKQLEFDIRQALGDATKEAVVKLGL